MKRNRHSPEQIIAKLREADALLGGGASIAAAPSPGICTPGACRLVIDGDIVCGLDRTFDLRFLIDDHVRAADDLHADGHRVLLEQDFLGRVEPDGYRINSQAVASAVDNPSPVELDIGPDDDDDVGSGVVPADS